MRFSVHTITYHSYIPTIATRFHAHTHRFNTTDANTRLRVDGWTLVGELLMPKHNVPWYGRNSYIGIDLNTSWFNDALADVCVRGCEI